jgi:hypothetical protein
VRGHAANGRRVALDVDPEGGVAVAFRTHID